jgi:ABC-2 type transport system ATP-binding protein
VSRRDFWRLIDDLSRGGTTVLVTTHYLDEAERCDRVAIIHAGKLAALGTIAELKSTFRTRPIFEIRSHDPVAAMAALDHQSFVEKTSLFGTTVHAVLGNRQAGVDDLTRALAAAQVAVTSLQRVQPSLEDVFLDVLDRVQEGSAA